MGTAVLFPGQGSQFVGMGADLYEGNAAARAIYDKADAQLGYSLSSLCFSGPEEKLTDTEFQQPAMFISSIAAWEAFKSTNRHTVDYLAGHSLGEYAALVAAGAVSFGDGLDLVRRRGALMKLAGDRTPGAMAAILALEAHVVDDICRQASDKTDLTACLANDNCPGQLVISGHTQAVDLAMAMAQEAGARKVVKLPISIAAHSALMGSISGEFAEAVTAATILPPQTPVIGNVTAQPLLTVDEIRREMNDQLTASVAWTASMGYLLSQNIDVFIEVGPGNVLLSLMKRIDRRTKRIKFAMAAD